MSTDKKPILTLIALVAVFIVPMIFSWLIVHYHEKLPLKTQNHGQLIKPVIANLLPGNHTWQIVYVPQHCCDQQCDTIMFSLHQLRIALGKEAKRVSLVRAGDNACFLQPAHDFQNLLLSDAMIKQWQKAFTLQNNFHINDKIYLVDPLGNIFMYYPATTNPMNILKDIQFTLGASQIG